MSPRPASHLILNLADALTDGIVAQFPQKSGAAAMAGR
jgi:hypothetical protein